jgi:hypothetical protein
MHGVTQAAAGGFVLAAAPAAAVGGLAFFAQSANDVVPGGAAGWASAGLLSGVVGWLLFVHLPAQAKASKDAQDAKDAQLKELIDGKDRHIASLVAEFRAESREQRAEAKEQRTAGKEALSSVCEEFRSELALERQACQKNFEAVAKSVDGLAQRVKQA